MTHSPDAELEVLQKLVIVHDVERIEHIDALLLRQDQGVLRGT